MENPKDMTFLGIDGMDQKTTMIPYRPDKSKKMDASPKVKMHVTQVRVRILLYGCNIKEPESLSL